MVMENIFNKPTKKKSQLESNGVVETKTDGINLDDVVSKLPDELSSILKKDFEDLNDALESLDLSDMEAPDAVDELLSYMNSRIEIIQKFVVDMDKSEYIRSSEGIEVMREFHEMLFRYEKIINIKQNGSELGRGQAGIVYGHELSGICVKFIYNLEMYAKSNAIEKELAIQKELKDLNVNGVIAPKVVDYFKEGKFFVIQMEKLDAVSLKDIREKNLPLPENFNIDECFLDLTLYVAEMHKLGIYHQDLHEGNIMIDLKTGKLRVIDFGRAEMREDVKAINDNIKQRMIDGMIANDESLVYEAKRYIGETIQGRKYQNT